LAAELQRGKAAEAAQNAPAARDAAERVGRLQQRLKEADLASAAKARRDGGRWTPDQIFRGQLAAKKDARAEEAYQEKQTTAQQAREDAAASTAISEHVVRNPEYFPPQMKGVEALMSKDPKTLTAGEQALIKDAKAWDTNPGPHEYAAALGSKTAEEFALKGTNKLDASGKEIPREDRLKNLTPAGISARTEFWNLAQSTAKARKDRMAGRSTPAPASPAAKDPYITGKAYRDASGKVMTYHGNGKWS
jgi:hypothetical protein